MTKKWIVTKVKDVFGAKFINYVVRVRSYKKDPKWSVNWADGHRYSTFKNAEKVAKIFDGHVVQVVE